MLLASHLKIKKDQEVRVVDYKLEFYFFQLYNTVDETVINHYLALFFHSFFQHYPKITFHNYEFFKEEETTSRVYIYVTAEEAITKKEKSDLCEKLGGQLDQLLEMLQANQQTQQGQESLAISFEEQKQMIEALSKRLDQTEEELMKQRKAVLAPTILSAIDGNSQLVTQLLNQINKLTWQVSQKTEPIKEANTAPIVIETQLVLDSSEPQRQLAMEEEQFKQEITKDLAYFKKEIITIFELFTKEETPETIKDIKNLFVEVDTPIDQLNYCLFYWQSISRYNLSIHTCRMNLEDKLEFLEKKLAELPNFLQEIENDPLKISPKTIQFDIQKNILGYSKLNTLMSRYYRESFDE